jgi:hypothetical protein
VRLDECPSERPVTLGDGQVAFDVPPRALRSILLS